MRDELRAEARRRVADVQRQRLRTTRTTTTATTTTATATATATKMAKTAGGGHYRCDTAVNMVANLHSAAASTSMQHGNHIDGVDDAAYLMTSSDGVLADTDDDGADDVYTLQERAVYDLMFGGEAGSDQPDSLDDIFAAMSLPAASTAAELASVIVDEEEVDLI
jgi:hypothetical protein